MLNGVGITWCKMCVLSAQYNYPSSNLFSDFPTQDFFFLTSSERELNPGITVSKFWRF